MDLIPQLIVDALLLGGIYTLMVIGLALSFGVTRVINFAHGEAVMLGAYGAFTVFVAFGVDPLIAMPVLMVAGCVLGMVLFKVAIAPVLKAPHVNQILLTFGIGLVLQNLALVIWSPDGRSVVPSYAYSSFEFGDVVVSGGRLIGFGIAAVLVLALFFWLKRTEFGRATRALAEQHDAAVLMGINVNQMYALAFGLSVALGVATGVILSFLGAITPFMGFHILVKGFAIIVLGGLGSIVGAVLGAFLLAFAETAVSYYVPNGTGWAEAVAFLTLFLVLVLRPRGIIGQAVAD
ncbi:branched-chain amino acid ABC transporter permease [Xanthobacter tagetidis]|jgi:branched-chain amino acid transport system permease protein|uniref:Branched-chain amino acid ABC transporter permease n=1 Tax=Xanthobacter tagetidis TaxID=60216 RepID=A0A3L6ZYY2_9HYPH|nr:branched-chain amino acid ABC transporter permease [Xanthobacter tagetidis]MBB6307115.1 branched-chain amino acid transport system permease protein [Xanthobacter tagetidis]RLP73243.1 branched-chain amino acid ABC transporter permease [Xanthobacter tagetidis]